MATRSKTRGSLLNTPKVVTPISELPTTKRKMDSELPNAKRKAPESVIAPPDKMAPNTKRKNQDFDSPPLKSSKTDSENLLGLFDDLCEGTGDGAIASYLWLLFKDANIDRNIDKLCWTVTEEVNHIMVFGVEYPCKQLDIYGTILEFKGNFSKVTTVSLNPGKIYFENHEKKNFPRELYYVFPFTPLENLPLLEKLYTSVDVVSPCFYAWHAFPFYYTKLPQAPVVSWMNRFGIATNQLWKEILNTPKWIPLGIMLMVDVIGFGASHSWAVAVFICQAVAKAALGTEQAESVIATCKNIVDKLLAAYATARQAANIVNGVLWSIGERVVSYIPGGQTTLEWINIVANACTYLFPTVLPFVCGIQVGSLILTSIPWVLGVVVMSALWRSKTVLRDAFYTESINVDDIEQPLVRGQKGYIPKERLTRVHRMCDLLSKAEAKLPRLEWVDMRTPLISYNSEGCIYDLPGVFFVETILLSRETKIETLVLDGFTLRAFNSPYKEIPVTTIPVIPWVRGKVVSVFETIKDVGMLVGGYVKDGVVWLTSFVSSILSSIFSLSIGLGLQDWWARVTFNTLLLRFGFFIAESSTTRDPYDWEIGDINKSLQHITFVNAKIDRSICRSASKDDEYECKTLPNVKMIHIWGNLRFDTKEMMNDSDKPSYKRLRYWPNSPLIQYTPNGVDTLNSENSVKLELSMEDSNRFGVIFKSNKSLK